MFAYLEGSIWRTRASPPPHLCFDCVRTRTVPMDRASRVKANMLTFRK